MRPARHVFRRRLRHLEVPAGLKSPVTPIWRHCRPRTFASGVLSPLGPWIAAAGRRQRTPPFRPPGPSPSGSEVCHWPRCGAPQRPALHHGAGPPAAALRVHLLVRQHGEVHRVPVNHGLALVHQPSLVQLQEQVLRPSRNNNLLSVIHHRIEGRLLTCNIWGHM